MIVVLELWEAQNLNPQAFCHSHACLGGKTLVLGGPKPPFSGLFGRRTGSDRKTLVLELWEAQNLNFNPFCHSHVGLGGWGGGAHGQ